MINIKLYYELCVVRVFNVLLPFNGEIKMCVYVLSSTAIPYVVLSTIGHLSDSNAGVEYIEIPGGVAETCEMWHGGIFKKSRYFMFIAKCASQYLIKKI